MEATTRPVVKIAFPKTGLDKVLAAYGYRDYLQAWTAMFGGQRTGVRWYEAGDGAKRPLRVSRLSREQFAFYKEQVRWWHQAVVKVKELDGDDLAVQAAETQQLVSEMMLLLV
ncbi:MAG: hypothetical protein KC423_08280 [Anaerolineales bacterium]|nr:hypothetical protein [Anaerolineales bacterium]